MQGSRVRISALDSYPARLRAGDKSDTTGIHQGNTPGDAFLARRDYNSRSRVRPPQLPKTVVQGMRRVTPSGGSHEASVFLDRQRHFYNVRGARPIRGEERRMADLRRGYREHPLFAA